MPNNLPSSPDLLLELLELLARGPRDREQILAELSRRASGLAAAGRTAQALEALEAEALIESRRHRGRVAYRATTAGLRALAARRPQPGVVAVLFTDLVGSTRLIDTFGEEHAHRLRQHHFSLLREAIAAHGGHEVKSLGDGLMVVFGDASGAVRCAEAMQRAVALDGDELQLRIGIDAGEPVREADDFFGTPVIVARRLCDAATSGQIVVSDRARKLADCHPESPYESLGTLSLKGLSEPVSVSALRVPIAVPTVASERVRRRVNGQLPLSRVASA